MAPAPSPPPLPTRRRGRWWRLPLKILAWALVVVILLVGVALVLLQTDYARERVRALALDGLNGAVAGRVEVDHLGGTLPLSVTLDGVRVYDPQGRLTLEVAHVDADLHPFDLLSHSVHLSDIHVTAPAVRLLDEAGQVALARAFAPRTPTPTDPNAATWQVQLERIQLAGGTLDALPVDPRLRLGEVLVGVTLSVDDEGLRWRDLGVETRVEGPLPVELRLRSDGALVGDEVVVDRLDVSAGPHRLVASGRVDVADLSTLRLDIDALEIDVDALPTGLLPPGPRLGQIEASGRVSRASGELNAALTVVTGIGRVEVQLGLSDGDGAGAYAPISQRIVFLDGLRPGGLAAGLPPGVLADGTVSFFGVGDPLRPRRLHLDVELTEQAPHPGGRLVLSVDRPQGLAALDAGDEALFDVRALITDLHLDPWLAAAGEPRLRARIAHVDLAGQLIVSPDAPPQLIAGGRFDVGASGEVAALGDTLALPYAYGTVDLQWDGRGWPLGSASLSLDGARLGPRRAEFLDLNLTLARPDGGAAHLSGLVSADGLRITPELSLGRLFVPLDLRLRDLDGLPEGRVEVEIERAVTGGARARHLGGAFKLTRAAGGLDVSGSLSGADVGVSRSPLSRSPPGAGASGGAIGAFEGNVGLWVGWRGGLDGDVALTLSGARYGDLISAQRLGVHATLGAREGLAAAPTLRGRLDMTGLRAGAISASTLAAGFDLALRDGEPVGTVDGVRATGLRVGGRTIERLGANATLQPGGAVAYDVRLDSGALTASLLGVLSLPLAADRRLDVALDRLLIARRLGAAWKSRQNETLLVGEGLRFVDGGVIEVGALHLSGPIRGSGELEARGTIDPFSGALDLRLATSEDLALGAWLAGLRELGGLSLTGVPSLAGGVSVVGTLGGTLAEPTLALRLGLSRGKIDDLQGLSLGLAVDVAPDGVTLGLGITWHAEGVISDRAWEGGGRGGERHGGGLQLDARLPVQLSLSPPGLSWDRRALIDGSLTAWDADLGASQRFLHGVRGGSPPADQVVGGQGRVRLVVAGRPDAPAVVLTADASGLRLGGLRDGRLTFGASSHKGHSHLDLSLVEVQRGGQPHPGQPGDTSAAAARQLIGVRIDAPFDVASALGAADPGYYMRSRAVTSPGRVQVSVPPTRLGDTPLAPLLGDALDALTVGLELDASGTLRQPRVAASRVTLDGLAWRGVDLALGLSLGSEDADLALTLSGSARGREVLRGTARLPDLGAALVDLGQAARILEDPRLRVLVQTPPLTGADLWDLNPALGELITSLLPDARVRLGLDARGAPGGPTAMLLGRVHAPSTADGGGSGGDQRSRNLADDVLFKAAIDADQTTVRLKLAQRGDFDPHVELRAEVPLGTGSLLRSALSPEGDVASGALAAPPTADGPLRFKASLVADEFRLDGLAGGAGAVLGPSRGVMRGKVGVSGTLDDPTFKGSLDFYFEELNVEPLGFHRDHLTALLLFGDKRAELLPIRVEGQPRRGSSGPSYLEAAMEVGLDSLTAQGVTLDGYVEMADFALLARKDLRGRLDARIDVTGSAAKPEIRGEVEVLEAFMSPQLGGRSVRALGLPRDVTLVSGAPVPPPDLAAGSASWTGATVDVKVKMPKGRVRIDNDMFALSPWSDLVWIRTVEGELVLRGTIHVPREHITLYDKRFVLSEDSRIIFSGDPSVDPQLRVTATYDISEVDLSPIGLTATPESRVTVRIDGSAARPILKLTSDPPMDEANIISVIVIGTPSGPGQREDNALRTQVANLVIGMATGRLSQFLTSQLPIDTFQLDTSSGDLTQSRLTVGKRLAKNLFFRYRMNMGADDKEESVNEFSAEYRVGPVTLLGEYGDIGEFSLEARLRLHD